MKPVTLSPIRPNLGLEAQYRRRLDALIGEMHRSLIYFLKAAYRANEPEMAMDDAGQPGSPARRLQAEMRRLGR